ncbi:MAG: hypothetical protein U1E87_11270, partial [Alphaproteobacteria bacterium]
MSLIDRALSAALFLGAVLQALASLRAYGADGEALLWALSASAFLALLASVNWLRAARPKDRPLATVTFAFGLLGSAFILAYGFVTHTFYDARIIGGLIVTLGL